MPRRKPRSPLADATVAHDAAAVDDQTWGNRLLNRSVERYGAWAHALAQEGLNHGRGVKEFERMMRALDWGDEEDFWRRCADWLQPYLDQDSGERQRLAGKRSPGRRGKYEGWYLFPCGQIARVPHYDEKEKTRATSDDLLAVVATRHAEYPGRTFNDVCEEVRKYFGYESAYSVKKAAKSIQWRSKTK